MTPPGAVVARIDSLPPGSCHGLAGSRRYLLSKSAFAGGRAVKIVAEEQGGSDYISCNLYRLARGPRLYPCEMPAEKVVAFLLAFRPEAQ